MAQHEYGVGLAAKPEELSRVALAFRAGEQKERDRVLELLQKMSDSPQAMAPLGQLVWTEHLSKSLGLHDPVRKGQAVSDSK
jgi:hypothetical protein